MRRRLFFITSRRGKAERERRAKIINAEGEFQAAERLKDAAFVIANHPVALQPRYLQTLREIGTTNSSTIVFPAPIDLLRPFLEGNGRSRTPVIAAGSAIPATQTNPAKEAA